MIILSRRHNFRILSNVVVSGPSRSWSTTRPPVCPPQTGTNSSSTSSGGNASNELVSTVVRLYADPVETTSSRRLKAIGGTPSVAGRKYKKGHRRSLLEEMGSLEVH